MIILTKTKKRFIKYFIISAIIALVLLCPFIFVRYNLFSCDYLNSFINLDKILDSISKVQNISLTVSVGIFGFLLTSLAIIVAFFDNSIMKTFSKTQGLDNLIDTFKYTFMGLIYTITTVVISVLFNFNSYCILFFLLTFLIYNIFSMFRCIDAIFIVIRNIAKKT